MQLGLVGPVSCGCPSVDKEPRVGVGVQAGAVAWGEGCEARVSAMGREFTVPPLAG